MLTSFQFEEIAKKLYATLPSGIQNLEHEIQQQFKEILQATFAKLDLVTREEFDVQIKVLARTREKLEMLEEQVEQLLREKA